MNTLVEPIKISDSEWEVMRVVWTKGRTDAKTINDLLSSSKGWKLATTKTLLGRLVKKNILHTEQNGKKFVYSAKVTEEQTVRSATENIFSHICAKKVGSTIADLVEEAELTQEDIDNIQAVLWEKAPVSEIACNCIPGQCICKEHGTEE
ncbi:CopY/TcrY family copper transport repressor [Tetragenococcus koreensis]|uniref:CopY/TcrY family copper transport repressor n=1 Tax=Tetragenococcus koreensis TaxID=290335 RepID=A0AAN4ZPL2_9ENTE|nr:CopY/TcrY family copper transport repressor [Tetragenococcus koreensis]AYW44546.1 CopY/TcrY family copper transport repressor [Tetragenococcus koreensis]MCF1584211.1 CopY/TcrY family copper transport repressor [Tetragenococcus koreensis]MCF1613855.1 CopY/TcrY family copper transport repressor [Tetragenococcus koreensis]MCF1617732.1 CopY/TcrY family copper transport repressor [Tetragenococcus koreensis]MCF1619565.1 CopY/TcrY family copper transport repressor [Tetragenococcus koreensis]